MSAVDRLQQMFPSVDRGTIENVLMNECGGDSTRAIVVLQKIQEFNAAGPQPVVVVNPSVTNPNAVGTGGGGEIQPQAVQVVTAPAHQTPPQQECCPGCTACGIPPLSYSRGLYPIDEKVYAISFIVFTVATFEFDSFSPLVVFLSDPILPMIGLIILFLGSVLYFVPIDPQYNKVKGALIILGGLLYMVGYIVHAINMSRYIFFNTIIVYLIGRGSIIFLHTVFFGLWLICPERLALNRTKVIRFWSFMYALLLGLSYGIFAGVIAGVPFIAVIGAILALVNVFIAGNDDSPKVGCTAQTSIAIILEAIFSLNAFLSFYYAYRLLLYFLSGVLGIFFWFNAIGFFGICQTFLLARAMSPAAANCGCKYEDSYGDEVAGAGTSLEVVAVQSM